MAAMLGNSSLNTLYSLINGPNADRIGGFIANAQVDDANRQREGIRLADAKLALDDKQANYSLTAALSRAPETAAMFAAGRDMITPESYDMAAGLTQQLPNMQKAELAGKQVDRDYKLALTDRARREPVGTDKSITPYQQRMLALDELRLNQSGDSQIEQRALRVLESGERQALGYDKLANDSRMLDKVAARDYAQRAQTIRDKAARDAESLYARPRGGAAAPSDKGLVQPTAAPQAGTTAAPQSNDRAWHVERAKTALARVTDPARRAEIMATAAKNGVTEQDLAK
jgi:hypothetical protein